MKNLFIVKKIIEDKTLSDEAFTVWCGLRNIMQKDVIEYFISFNMIAYSVFNRVPTRYELDAIKKGYTELVCKEYIKVVTSFASKTEFIVDLSDLYFAGQEYFSDLSMEEMHKIMNLDSGRQSKYKLLRYFACQVSTFNRSIDMDEKYRGKIGGMGLDTFVEMLGYSKVSILAYNDILSENKLLFVHNHGDFYTGTNAKGQNILREIPNTYARYSDMELALSYVGDKHGYKFYKTDNIVRSANANKKRALGQKLKNFMNGKEYDVETIKELYVYVEEKNDALKANYQDQINKGYTTEEPDYIDINIFNDYLIAM